MGVVEAFWAGAQTCGGPVDVVRLAERVGGWRALVSGGLAALEAGGVDPLRARAWIRVQPYRSRGTVLTLEDPRYPPRLRAIPCAPPVLLVEGSVDALDAQTVVAVVGTRRCTSYGSSVARHLGGALAAAGWPVVSGLARGVDGHAHRAALAVGRTVAVVGHGLDHTAPPSNRRLREQIVESGGAIVSTWPDTVSPRPSMFPVRNRWIAGLSDAVVVVEAAERSGARITAREAGDLGRDVWAVPGPVGAPMSRGCLHLLAQGAGVVVDVPSLVSELGRTEPLGGDEAWLRSLFAGSTVDEVARSTGRAVSELVADLARRELRGEGVRLPGQRYAPGVVLC